jgi:hypothetical protein
LAATALATVAFLLKIRLEEDWMIKPSAMITGGSARKAGRWFRSSYDLFRNTFHGASLSHKALEHLAMFKRDNITVGCRRSFDRYIVTVAN